MASMTRILGIDPGSRHTGYGIIEGEGRKICHLASGAINVAGALPLPKRLHLIYQQLDQLIREWHPNQVAVEAVFFAKNVKSALVLGQARGAAILAGVNAGLEVAEYSALEIKQAVVGYGRADKSQVEQMIKVLLQLRCQLNGHAADALAVAVCHLNTGLSRSRWAQATAT